VPLPGGALIMAAGVAPVSESGRRRWRGTLRAACSLPETDVSNPHSDWSQLTRDLSARVAAFAPEWTDPVDEDPGITLVELLSFLAESLLDRADAPPHVAGRLREFAAQVERLAASRCADATVTRPRYFEGKLLTAADFDQEQDYVRARQRRHNRLLHGTGVVTGMSVTVGSENGEPVIIVSPGLGIGPTGEELLICERVTVPLKGASVARLVTVGLAERSTHPDVSGEPTRIEESAEIAVVEHAGADHLVIGKLIPVGGAVQVDPAFEPARVKR
jgi:hypothetical protein